MAENPFAQFADHPPSGVTNTTDGGQTQGEAFTPPTTAARGTGLGVRDVIEGTLGGPYDLIARGINAIGLLPPINTLSENLTKLGLPSPQTPTERTISAVQQPVAGTLVPLGAGRVIARAANPVVQTVGRALTEQPVVQAVSAGAGAAATEATGDPRIGLAVSMLSPFGAAGAGMAARRLENAAFGGISKSDAELGRLAQQKYKIPIGAPDLTDNTMIRIGADQAGKLPLSGARPAAEAKQAAWQGAIAEEMGAPGATNFKPDVLGPNAHRISSGFNEVAQRTSITPTETAQLEKDLDSVLFNARRLLQPGEIAPLETQVRDIKALIAENNGTISGEAYQRITNAKSLLSKLERQDSNAGDLASDVRDHLDDAFARSSSPEDQAALQTLRYQYRVMRTVDQLAAKSRTGDISPDAFMEKVVAASRKYDAPTGGIAYTGGGNIGELARIGKMMRAPPQTGTADRAMVNAATGAFGGGTAAAGLAHLLSPQVAIGVPATLLANRMAGAYLRSGSLANRLIEGAIGPEITRPNPLMQAFQTSGVTSLEALLQNQRRQQD
jgi:hypothetical protein